MGMAMSNRFNRPDMLKTNRQRINKMRAHRAALIEARRFIEGREEARSLAEAREIIDKYGEHMPPGATIEYRDTRPWHERFLHWATGC